jgi:hypothetical protein
LLPLYPFSMSKSQSFLKLSHLYTISPPLSPISIKGVFFIDANASIRVDSWHLNLHFWWTSSHLLEWHHLYSLWDTTHKIFDLDTNWWDISPYVIAWVIHLIDLSSCWWGMHSSFDDHLKLKITCGTIILYGWYHV